MYCNDAIEAEKKSEKGFDKSLKEFGPTQLSSNLPADNTDVTLVHKQQTTRQITTVTKVVREVKHFQPDGYVINYGTMPFDTNRPSNEVPPVDFTSMAVGLGSQFMVNDMGAPQHQTMDQVCIPDGTELHSQYATQQNYEHYPTSYSNSSIYVTKSPALTVSRGGGGGGPQQSYRQDLNACGLMGPPGQMTPSSQEVNLSGVQQDHELMPTIRYMQASHYDDMPEYGITAASSCQAESHYADDTAIAYGYVSETKYGLPSGGVNASTYSPRPLLFDDNLNGSDGAMPSDPNSRPYDPQSDFQNKMSQLTLNPLDVVTPMRDVKDELLDPTGVDMCPTMRWRDPNLSEVISFLNNPNNAIKANAAAYLAHLCYMDDVNKQRTRTLGGIPPLIRLLSYDVPEIHKNACGALRNLSYGRQNDENKRAIKNHGGITALVNLLCRTQESEVRELVTGVLWNMSSCEDIKRSIIDEALTAVVNNIIKPHSGWDTACPGDTCYSTVFRNASGVLRNVSSAGEYARASLRDAKHLVDCLLYVLRTAIQKNNINNKTVENCVCILRNLSYRCQEVEDPNYDKHPMQMPTRAVQSTSKGENLGCFGTTKRKKESQISEQQADSPSTANKTNASSSGSVKAYEQLWKPDVVQYYLSLLQSCSNPETLEAAAGAIQNLSACYWQPSIDIRATVRKEKGLPILVELLRMEVDRVVCAVATALRNLAIDQRNKELIGKYAMRDLVQKLPSGNPQHDQSTSDDTISAVLATINEVIKKNPEFSRSLLDAGGVERLMNITKQQQKYTACVLKFACQVLFTMWQHHELRDVYKKNGWKEQDFVTKSIAAYNAAPNSPGNANNTLNRPMASQGRTRYEDRTLQRAPNNASRNNRSGHAMCNEPSPMLCQMVDDVQLNGVTDDPNQRIGQNSTGAAMYMVDSRRNHTN